MALRQQIPVSPRWPTVATAADLPNVLGSPKQSGYLQSGDTCYVQADSALYVCITPSLGAAVWSALTASTGGTGVDTIDFGSPNAFTQVAERAIAAPAIQAGSVVEAWLNAVATADHSVDEHLVDGPRVFAGGIVPGVGFTITGVATDRPGSKLYGEWSVAWRWS